MKAKSDNLSFSPFQWIIISMRAFCLITALGTNYLIQKFVILISSLFPFQIWKRYISCITNLIMNRIALLALGYFHIETGNFKFFSKLQPKINLKSGFIGMGTHKNIIDFLYYSYIFNPMFVRLILIVEKEMQDGKQVQFIKEINYSPLDYQESLRCSIKNRGFQPIIVRNQKQLKKIKYRKMNMKTLVSQSFQQLKGAIFILLPGLQHNVHIQIDQKITNDIYQNETKYLRSGIGLKVKLDDRPVFQQKYKNQIHFLLHVMSQFKINKMLIDSFTFRNYKSYYKKDNYRNFIEQIFFLTDIDVKLKKISYIEYLRELNQQQEFQQGNKKDQKKDS